MCEVRVLIEVCYEDCIKEYSTNRTFAISDHTAVDLLYNLCSCRNNINHIEKKTKKIILLNSSDSIWIRKWHTAEIIHAHMNGPHAAEPPGAALFDCFLRRQCDPQKLPYQAAF